MKEFKDLKQEWLQDPEVKKAYLEMKPEFEIAGTLIAARAKARLTQAEVAKGMGTTQSVVARLESGRTLPSIKTLYSYAKAVGAKPTIRLDQN